MGLKPRNAVAIALGIVGGIIFGGMRGAAKVIQDDAYNDIKTNLKDWMESKKAEKEESEEDEA